jgi:hypothetical protein
MEFDANLKKVYNKQIKDLTAVGPERKSLFRKIRKRLTKDSPIKITTLKPKIPSGP